MPIEDGPAERIDCFVAEAVLLARLVEVFTPVDLKVDEHAKDSAAYQDDGN